MLHDLLLTLWGGLAISGVLFLLAGIKIHRNKGADGMTRLGGYGCIAAGLCLIFPPLGALFLLFCLIFG